MRSALTFISLLLLAGCPSTVKECSPQTCLGGCCDALGTCQPSSNTSCPGIDGQCTSCLPGSCSLTGCVGLGGGGGSNASGGGSGGGGGQNSDAAVAACNQIADAIVAADVRCGVISPSGMGSFRNQLSVACASVPPSLLSGREQLGNATACQARLAALSCPELPTLPPYPYAGISVWRVCDELLVGTVSTGQTCTSNNECTDDSYCDTTTCPRLCLRRLADGQSATTAVQCLSAAVYAGKCVSPVALAARAPRSARVPATDRAMDRHAASRGPVS